MKYTLLLLSLIGPIFAAPSEDWTDVLDDVELLEDPGYIVSNNITIDPLEEIDTTIPGVRLAERSDVDDVPTPGVEPRSDVLDARAANVRTNFFLGKSRAEYGCDQKVRPIIQAAVAALCRQEACDETSSYYHRIKWSNRQGWANLKVNLSGFYYGNVRHHLIAAAQATVVEKAFTSYKKRWNVQVGLGGQITLSCQMSRFPNYIQIDRRVNGNMRDQIKIRVTPPEEPKQNFCMLGNVMNSIIGPINGIAGGFFGVVIAGACS